MNPNYRPIYLRRETYERFEKVRDIIEQAAPPEWAKKRLTPSDAVDAMIDFLCLDPEQRKR